MPYHHFTREEQYIVSHLSIAGFPLESPGGGATRNITIPRLMPHQ